MTLTVRLKLGFVSKSSTPLVSTVSAPVVGSIANAPPTLPSVMANVWLWPLSGSLYVTVPTAVPFALFSGTLNVAGATAGASFGVPPATSGRKAMESLFDCPWARD